MGDTAQARLVLAALSKSFVSALTNPIALGLEYIQLAHHFVEEVLQTYENWNGKDGVPPKLQELMMLLEIEVSDRYK